jgi:hypothetical protein
LDLGWITAASTFFVGLAVGAGGVQSYQRFHEKATAEVFSRRLHCNELANQYARKETNDTQSADVEIVGYAAVSNSCVAYFQLWERISQGYTVREWLVMDLLSSEVFDLKPTSRMASFVVKSGNGHHPGTP